MKEKNVQKQLLWLDLEMTGLDSSVDLITEVAVVVTDFSFKPLVEYSQGIYQQSQILAGRLENNPWFKEQPEAYRREIYEISAQGKPLAEVESDLIQIADEYITDKRVVLAGNSIHTDRGFVDEYLPAFSVKLHYRMLDVSAYKIYVQALTGLEFDKKETHRALVDIYESIAEMKFCLERIKALK